MGNKPRIRFKGFTEDWEQRKLSDVADVRDGTHDSPKFYNDGFPLVTSKNLKGGSIDFSDCSFISEQDFNEINKRSKVDPGDILFGMIGTIGNPAIVEHTGFAIKNVALIKEGNIINNRFIYHLLSSKVFENYIARENAGGTQKFIALNQIRNFDFLAPALVEQNKIIELLDCISQNITLHQCKLEKLKLTKKALLQKLFPKNGKHIPEIRFKGFTDAWEQRKLSDVADVRDGTHDSPKFYNDGFPLVTSKNLKGGSIDFSDCSFISEQDFNEINKRSKVDPGDILFGMIGTIGNPAIVEHTGFAIKNVALIKEGNIINNRFIYHLLSSKVFENYIARENAGGTQKFIALNQIRNFDFLAPALVEQNKIIELLDCISQNITLHQ